MKISVILPAWNEGDNLFELTKAFVKVFWSLDIKYELIYVLRGTRTESGYDMLNHLFKDYNLKLIYADDIHGYAPSIQEGVKYVSEDSTHILTMDADRNHAPNELARFLYHKQDIVIGSRGDKRTVGPWWKKQLSKLLNGIISKTLKLGVVDITSGYRLYKKNVFLNIFDKPKATGFDYLPELLIIAKKKGYTFKEVPITFSPRVIGISKMPVVKTAIGYLKLMWRYL